MKFDVVIGNPPYQEVVANNSGSISQANPLYQYFVQSAIEDISNRYVSMITPSLWLTSGTGLDNFRKFMLTNNHISVMHDFESASDVFPNVSLAGGVSYFMYDKEFTGKTKYTYIDKNKKYQGNRNMANSSDFFIRDPRAEKILEKIGIYSKDFKSFMDLVSTYSPFAKGQVGNYKELFKDKPGKGTIKIYRFSRNRNDGKFAYIDRNKILAHTDWIDKHKVYVSKAGEISAKFNGLPFYGEPGTACNETYLVVGPFDTKDICDNVISYMNTDLYKYLISHLKKSQNAARSVYRFVPMQDFSKPWTNEKLYKLYGLTAEEIACIESKTK